MISVRIAVVGLALLAAACTNNTTTPSSTSSTTSTTTTTTPVTTPTTSEPFASTLAVGGAAFYSFNIAANGTVNVTLKSAVPARLPTS